MKKPIAIEKGSPSSCWRRGAPPPLSCGTCEDCRAPPPDLQRYVDLESAHTILNATITALTGYRNVVSDSAYVAMVRERDRLAVQIQPLSHSISSKLKGTGT